MVYVERLARIRSQRRARKCHAERNRQGVYRTPTSCSLHAKYQSSVHQSVALNIMSTLAGGYGEEKREENSNCQHSTFTTANLMCC
jgi:hypothetical protein